MTPTKITLQRTATRLNLVVTATGTEKGYVIIDGTPFSNGGPKPKTIIHLRKSGTNYAKRFGIPFVDQTVA
jgi:hypothetical protein